MNLIDYMGIIPIAAHEFLHYLPAWLFGLNPKMTINNLEPETVWDSPNSSIITLVIVLFPILGGFPLYLRAIFATLEPNNIITPILWWATSAAWVSMGWYDLKAAFSIIFYKSNSCAVE